MGPGSGPACDIVLNTALTEDERRRFQDTATIRRLLAASRTIAVVGLSTDPQKASQFVATYLRRHGYRIVPVTPRAASAGLAVVVDRCIKMEHGRWSGTLHWAGMNTEIVSARKPRLHAEPPAPRRAPP